MSTRQSRSKSRSPRNSASSSTRRALHARSDSDTNELAGRHVASLVEDDNVYRQSPFPRLPSQVLSPKGSVSIFEDRTATAAAKGISSFVTKPLPSSRVPRTATPRGRVKAKATVFNDAKTPASTEATRPPSKTKSEGPLRDPLHANPVDVGIKSVRPARATSRVRSIVSAIESAADDNPLPPTPKPPTPKVKAVKSPNLIERHAHDDAVPELPPTLPRLESLAGQPSAAANSPVEDHGVQAPSHLLAHNLGEATPAEHIQAYEDRSTLRQVTDFNPLATTHAHDRPRSASTPIAPTDAFLRALVAEGTSIQYPKLEKPSITSLRTDTSSVRGAAPRPLKLRRKRARSYLSRAESVAQFNDDDQGFEGGVLSSPTADQGPTTPERIHEPDSGRWTPGRWTAELEDTVAPLDRHPLRAQHSYHRDRERNRDRDSYDSRPTSRSSMESSSSGGFYRFLNDSRTAWAKSYYCNEGVLPLVTPPHVIQLTTVRAPRTPSSRGYSMSVSGPTQTPESEDFNDSIYIPRVRPFQDRPLDDGLTIRPALSEESIPPSSIRRISTSSGIQGEIDISHHDPPAQPESIRETHHESPTPRSRSDAHLSRDKGVSVRYSLLQAPSLDGTSWRSPANVQVGLLISGIILPFTWMIGACLPLPPRPHMQEIQSRAGRLASDTDDTDALRYEEVKRWQKVRWWRNFNRFMSVPGLCVIATIVTLSVVATH